MVRRVGAVVIPNRLMLRVTASFELFRSVWRADSDSLQVTTRKVHTSGSLYERILLLLHNRHSSDVPRATAQATLGSRYGMASITVNTSHSLTCASIMGNIAQLDLASITVNIAQFNLPLLYSSLDI